ncbi:CRAL-TRIO domain-containing protein [Pseudomassariella vexata]|uniref:Phosphatidylinositol transfer protein SFH5 n=1 Tax=Pseudomassariella vexata TaxID=1141098 RepID=A0A1Y2EAH5_9PEZI|nr:CRAL-TRIO domain-containing protein [Pseudomassariella vexata]ORY68590.1 CRAL-TRIO domain-containing protein [Pseudomassariella vexata]
MSETPVASQKVAEAPETVVTAPSAAPVPEASVETAPAAATETKTAEIGPVTETGPEKAEKIEKTASTDATAAAASPAAETATLTPLQELWSIAKANGHPEIWGVTLADPDSDIPSQIVFQKYLNANDGEITKAKDQLVKTLEWRAKVKPLELLTKTFSKAKFEGLGYVNSYTNKSVEGPEDKEVFTFNVYGIVKSMDATFGDVEEFMTWRAALMELALQELSLANATTPITATYDPYKIFQVHDYKSLSFFRQNPKVKTASTEVIKVFAQVYPELLKEKFFVNVPAIMGFMYGIMKIFVAAKTIKKFHPMSNGGALANEFTSAKTKVERLGAKLPKEYGGQGEDLQVQGKAIALE